MKTVTQNGIFFKALLIVTGLPLKEVKNFGNLGQFRIDKYFFEKKTQLVKNCK